MSPPTDAETEDELRAAYDLSRGVRGKCYEQYHQGTTVVFLDPDVAAVFRASVSVNNALRLLISLARDQVGAAP